MLVGRMAALIGSPSHLSITASEGMSAPMSMAVPDESGRVTQSGQVFVDIRNKDLLTAENKFLHQHLNPSQGTSIPQMTRYIS